MPEVKDWYKNSQKIMGERDEVYQHAEEIHEDFASAYVNGLSGKKENPLMHYKKEFVESLVLGAQINEYLAQETTMGKIIGHESKIWI